MCLDGILWSQSKKNTNLSNGQNRENVLTPNNSDNDIQLSKVNSCAVKSKKREAVLKNEPLYHPTPLP